MTPYAIPNCPRRDYDAIQAINQSSLKAFERSAAHFRYESTAPRKPPGKPMILGSLTEHFTLGTEFEYEAMRFDSFRTKEAQEWRDNLAARSIPIVDEETADKARSMTARVKALPEFTDWHPWRTNIALVGVHEPTGLAMKGLVDAAPDNHLVMLDLKTTADASEWGFGKSIADYGYDIQAYWYQSLWRQAYTEDRQFAFICVESEAPFEPSIQVIKQEDIDRAGRAVDRWMAQYKACLETNTWPGYPAGLTYAKVPAYRFRDM